MTFKKTSSASTITLINVFSSSSERLKAAEQELEEAQGTDSECVIRKNLAESRDVVSAFKF